MLLSSKFLSLFLGFSLDLCLKPFSSISWGTSIFSVTPPCFVPLFVLSFSVFLIGFFSGYAIGPYLPFLFSPTVYHIFSRFAIGRLDIINKIFLFNTQKLYKTTVKCLTDEKRCDIINMLLVKKILWGPRGRSFFRVHTQPSVEFCEKKILLVSFIVGGGGAIIRKKKPGGGKRYA